MKKKKILMEVFILFFIAAVFMAVYVVIEMGNDWLAVLGGAAVLLIAAYLLIDYWFEYRSDSGEQPAEEEKSSISQRMDALEEVQKATYTVIKRGNGEQAELLRSMDAKLTQLTQAIERMGDVAFSANTMSDETKQAVLQSGKNVLDAVKGMRQDYQTGVKNLIKYEKENAKQLAEQAHTNTEMTIIELNAQFGKIVEKLEAQQEQLAFMRFSAPDMATVATAEPEPAQEFNPELMMDLIDNSDMMKAVPDELNFTLPMDEDEDEELLPVLEDAATELKVKPAAVAGPGEEEDKDAFDAEAAIKAYMIEQGFVDVDEESAEPEESMMIPEPVIIEESEPEIRPQKSEEEIANTLQSMASGDPNRALTPEEIAAMFAAVQ